MSFYRLMFPGVRSSPMFSGFGLKPSASGAAFSPCLGLMDSFVLNGVGVVVVCLVFKLTADEIMKSC